MSDFITPFAIFDLIVDGEIKATVDAPSRGEAGRMLYAKAPEYASVFYQRRAQVVVREHEHAPAAGNTSVCVFCQTRLDKE